MVGSPKTDVMWEVGPLNKREVDTPGIVPRKWKDDSRNDVEVKGVTLSLKLLHQLI